MKLMLFVLSCVVALPVCGFSQTNGTPTPLITPPPNANDVPGTATGLVTGFSRETITVKTEAANPMSFALTKAVRYTDKKGHKIKQDRIKAGARVQIYYEGGEDTRTATRIVLEG